MHTRISSYGLAGPNHELQCRWRLQLPFSAIPVIRAAADFVAIVALSVLTGSAYHMMSLGQLGELARFAGSGMVVAALLIPLLHARQMYSRPWPTSRALNLAGIWTLVFLFLTAVAFALKISHDFSRGAVLSFYGAGLVSMLLLHRAMDWTIDRALARGSLRRRRVAVVADPMEMPDEEFTRTLQERGWQIDRWAVIPTVEGSVSEEHEEWSKLANDLHNSLPQNWPDEIMLALSWSDPNRVDQVMRELRKLPVSVHLMPDRGMRALLKGRTIYMAASVAVELQRAPLTELDRVLKRCSDLVVAGLGLVCLAPLFVLVAAAVRLDSPGPAFFRQSRRGFNNIPFRIYKFRTMSVMNDGPHVEQARRNDPRVTRVGRWLRKSSIDELPQLINVIRGEMSLVGPRPHALAHDNAYEAIIADYALRYHVKPGITGWAQVNGLRGETSSVSLMVRRVEYDLWYIKHWSFAFDIRILLKTIVTQFNVRDVY